MLATVRPLSRLRQPHARRRPRAHVDPTHDWFAGQHSFGGKPCKLYIGIDDPDDAETAARTLTDGCAKILATERGLPELLDRVTEKMEGAATLRGSVVRRS